MTLAIYIASPYTGPTPKIMRDRFHGALHYTAYLLHRGLHPYSPIVHFHELADWQDLPKDFEFWRDLNYNMLARCDALHVLCWVGWRKSVGVAAEIEKAKELNKPITYVVREKDGYKNSKRAPK